MQTLNSNNRSSSSSVSDTLSNCSSIATSNTAPLTTAKNDSASEVHLGHSGTQNEHSDLRGAILNAYRAECEAELLRVENQALKERCSYLEEEAAKTPRCTKPHGMSSRDRGEISRLKADKILAQSKLERSERIHNLLKTDIEKARERYDSMYRYHRREIARLNARNEALKDEHDSLKSQLDTACTEARTHARAELAALTSLVAANLERAAFKRQIWELENRCTELRVEASKPTPCSRPHSTSRPRTYSQATTDAATMTEPLQPDSIAALPTPPATPQPASQPIFPRYYTGDTLVCPGVETATVDAAAKTAAAMKTTAIKVARAIKRAAKAALQPTPEPASQPAPQLVFPRYYTGDTLVCPGVETATAEAAATKTATAKAAKAIKKGSSDCHDTHSFSPPSLTLARQQHYALSIV